MFSVSSEPRLQLQSIPESTPAPETEQDRLLATTGQEGRNTESLAPSEPCFCSALFHLPCI